MYRASVTWNFTYDANGMRTSRTDGTTTYNYVYNGGLLSKMTVGDNVLVFAYDASGAPMTVTYNGTIYYYLTNIQGDVVSIVDADGVLLVHYVYDAWGNLHATEGTMDDTLGVINPLRYRGYVYDQETELYYLQSRYYNPEIGRFLNADAYTSTGQGFVGNNMFAYCLNNPSNYLDIHGSSAAEAAEYWTATMWWLCAADGPVPAGDIIYAAGCIFLGVIALDALVTELPAIEMGTDYVTEYREHTKGARNSTKGKHEQGQRRKNKDSGNEKGDERRTNYRVNKKKKIYKKSTAPRSVSGKNAFLNNTQISGGFQLIGSENGYRP